MPPLGADLVCDVEQIQVDEPPPPATTDDAPASPSQAANQAPSSSRATPSSGSVVMPLARVQKLEAQMDTLLQHVKPWMHRSISESEARMEQRMEHMMDLKSTRARGKRPCSSCTSNATEDARTKKQERQQTEQARRVSIVDEEFHQQRVRECNDGASSSMPAIDIVAAMRDDVSTTDGDEMIDRSATDGVPRDDIAGFGKPNPSAC
uniref:Integrase core domain containing protein n=1 Tax=Solanum tuberosum TaxID=4113 RepID=M1DIM9_SOLTU